jgi:hypothetical protein
MEVTLDGLIREIQASSTDTLQQLETASSRAAELTDLSDALLNHFVDRCRKDGHTWAEIGEHLGVTRQAVQKRFVVASRQVTFERFTDRARAALANARREAVALQHNYVGTEHLLLALFDTAGGVSDQALAEMGIAHDEIKQAVTELIGLGASPVEGEPGFTPRASQVLQEATNIAVAFGHNYIGTEHLLLGLYKLAGGVAAKLLDERGATEARALEIVLRLLAGFQKS